MFPSFFCDRYLICFCIFFQISANPLSVLYLSRKQGTNNIFPMILFGTSHLISEARSVSFLPQRSRSYFDRAGYIPRDEKSLVPLLLPALNPKRYSIKYSTREVSSRFAFWESIPTGLFRKITFSSSYNTFSFTLLFSGIFLYRPKNFF